MMFRIIREGRGRTYLSCSPSHISLKGGINRLGDVNG